ncbi:zinc finger, PMZ-type containing protein [Tanacetum coccineum]
MLAGNLSKHALSMWEVKVKVYESLGNDFTSYRLQFVESLSNALRARILMKDNIAAAFKVGMGKKWMRDPDTGKLSLNLMGFRMGDILTAVGRDANDQMFPIAWAIVEVEKKDSWLWFLNLLKVDLGMIDGNGWSILSDQQKGLIPAIDTVLPNAEHRLCARHVLTNWQRRFSGDTLKSMFWKVAHSTTKRQMLDALDEIFTFAGQDAKDDLLTIDPSYWCKAFFNTYIKCDANQNNHCEAFNGVEKIIEARHKKIIAHPPSCIVNQLLAYMKTKFANDVKEEKDLMKVYDELDRSLKTRCELITQLEKVKALRAVKGFAFHKVQELGFGEGWGYYEDDK